MDKQTETFVRILISIIIVSFMAFFIVSIMYRNKNLVVKDNSCSFELNGKCFYAPQVPEPVTKTECEILKASNIGIKGCHYDKDYWAGAVKVCGSLNNMATKSELKQIAEDIYKIPLSDYDWTFCNGENSKLHCFVTPSHGITPGMWFWSAEETNSENAYLRSFYEGGSAYGDTERWGFGGFVICKKSMDNNL